jgi:hypothetical protein
VVGKGRCSRAGEVHSHAIRGSRLTHTDNGPPFRPFPNFATQPAAVPEPKISMLVAGGLFAVGLVRVRSSRRGQ